MTEYVAGEAAQAAGAQCILCAVWVGYHFRDVGLALTFLRGERDGLLGQNTDGVASLTKLANGGGL